MSYACVMSPSGNSGDGGNFPHEVWETVGNSKPWYNFKGSHWIVVFFRLSSEGPAKAQALTCRPQGKNADMSLPDRERKDVRRPAQRHWSKVSYTRPTVLEKNSLFIGLQQAGKSNRAKQCQRRPHGKAYLSPQYGPYTPATTTLSTFQCLVVPNLCFTPFMDYLFWFAHRVQTCADLCRGSELCSATICR